MTPKPHQIGLRVRIFDPDEVELPGEAREFRKGDYARDAYVYAAQWMAARTGAWARLEPIFAGEKP